MPEPRLLTIDCEYTAPRFAAAYLRVQDGEAAFVETGTAHAVPRMLAALAAEGLRPEDVRYVIITHVHLDHAGGAAALMAACPRATLLAHPRAARHAIDPSKLVASATQVYGAARFAALYGSVDPIPAERVRALDDGAAAPLGTATLHFHHVRGHANHHFVVHDPAAGTVFTGDAFGLVYPALQRARPFALPSTSPTDFDGPAALTAVDRIVSLATPRVHPTHFGEVTAIAEVAAQLRRWLELSSDLVRAHAGAPQAESQPAIGEALRARLPDEAAASGLTLDAQDLSLLALDLDLNAQGLAFAASRATR
jgi:glyoxylase-like metal-dependent hydrolase (beta-lactamase superfamily II)